MVDLVNTCSARVPHLLRLLPLPKFKSWVVAIISEDTPPQASKQASGGEGKAVQQGQGLTVQSQPATSLCLRALALPRN